MAPARYPVRSPDSKSLFKYKSCPQDGSPVTQDIASPTSLVQVSHEDAFSLRRPQESMFHEPSQLLLLRPYPCWMRSPVSFQSSRLSAPEMWGRLRRCQSLLADAFLQAEHAPKGAKKDRKSAVQGSNKQHVPQAPIGFLWPPREKSTASARSWTLLSCRTGPWVGSLAATVLPCARRTTST